MNAVEAFEQRAMIREWVKTDGPFEAGPGKMFLGNVIQSGWCECGNETRCLGICLACGASNSEEKS